MTIYTVLVPGSQAAESDPMAVVLVKEGFCWPALFVAELWLIFRRLWWVLLGYIVAVAVVIGIGQLLGDAFTGPALIALQFLFALEANELRRWTLRRHGYRLAGVVEGRDIEEAEIRYFAGLATPATEGAADQPQPPTAGPLPPSPPPAPPPLGPIAPSAESGDVVGLFPARGAQS